MAEYSVRGPSAFQPSHPGELLREDVLPAPRLNVTEAEAAACRGKPCTAFFLAGRP